MSTKFTMGEASGHIGEESSPPVSLSMADKLPIGGVDTSTGEKMAIDSSPRLTEDEDPFWVDPIAGGLYLWFRHSFGLEMPLYVFKIIYQARKMPKKKDALPRCELLSDVVEVLCSIYWSPPLNRRCGYLLNRHRCLTELGLMASRAEFNQGKRPRPTMARLATKKSRLLVLLVKKKKAWSSSQVKKVAEGDDVAAYNPPPLQRTLSVTATGEVVLDAPPKLPQFVEGSEGGAYDSKRKLRELIGPPGVKIPNDVVCDLLFYPAMGAQAFKKYFSPKWEDFASNGDLEDALEASLAVAVRTTGMQLKVLGEFRLQMQRHKKFVAEASKFEKHKQALDSLQVAVDSMRTTYERLQIDLKKSDSNVLLLMKKLDDANATQKITAEALEAANQEKK
ncbi:hypothetical protein Adt_18437 [Abeliophyllum distichum]|uniref:Uncharacterized protein n=1 Tax=Abeliophyllum distichum TaxID=126358 RepID=A0ABD1TJE2_9LAMI